MKDLIDTWKQGRGAVNDEGNPEAIIRHAKARKKEVLYAHYGTILILTTTLIIIALYFYKTPFVHFTSRAGMWLMLGALSLRIIVEIISIVKSNKIQLTANTEQLTQAALSFYRFRKTVHEPVTLVIVGAYVAGFYLLTPELSIYIPVEWMIAMHLSFVAGALFLVWVIRKGIRKEITSLEHLAGIRNEIVSVESKPVI